MQAGWTGMIKRQLVLHINLHSCEDSKHTPYEDCQSGHHTCFILKQWSDISQTPSNRTLSDRIPISVEIYTGSSMTIYIDICLLHFKNSSMTGGVNRG